MHTSASPPSQLQTTPSFALVAEAEKLNETLATSGLLPFEHGGDFFGDTGGEEEKEVEAED